MIAADAYCIVEESAIRLVIAVPGASLMPAWLATALGAMLLLVVYLTSRTAARVTALEKSAEETAAFVTRYRLIGVLISVAALLLFWAVSYSSGSITLDRSANRAVMQSKMTLFLPAQTQQIALSSVRSARIDAKPNSRRILLITDDGNDLGYPMWSSRDGQNQAVNAINRFLGGR